MNTNDWTTTHKVAFLLQVEFGYSDYGHGQETLSYGGEPCFFPTREAAEAALTAVQYGSEWQDQSHVLSYPVLIPKDQPYATLEFVQGVYDDAYLHTCGHQCETCDEYCEETTTQCDACLALAATTEVTPA